MGCVNCVDDRQLEVIKDYNTKGTAMPPKRRKVPEGGELFEKYRRLFRHQEVIQELGPKGEKFLDDEFAPDHSSLNKTGKAPASWKNFAFKRATEFMDPKEIAVFRGIDPSDIKQGALGDCYLLCCLSTLAERPNLVERLIITEEFNNVGCYAIWLCDAGTWRSVIVDDYFPVNPNTRQPAFTKSNGPELWVLLLEKAYAKIFGGYDVIEGGLPQFALKDLTGAPYDSRESTDPEVMWAFIDESNKKNYLLTCYSKSTEIREEKNPLGIVSGHAYSILDAKEVTVDGITDRIVQIRNPWGKFEWKGDWGDDSPKWTPEAIAQVDTFKKADDGTFWMSINDFVTYYEGVGICKLHEDYYYQSIKLKHEGNPLPNFRQREDDFIPYENPNQTVVRLNIENRTHLFLSVNQSDERKFLVSEENYQYSNVRIIVSKITSNGLKYEAGASNTDRDVVCETTLNRGSYLVTIEIIWEQDFHKKFTLSAYSQNPVFLERLGNADFTRIERNVVKSLALKSPSSRCKDYSNVNEPNIKRYMGSEYGIVYFYYNNQGSKALKETVTMNNRVNLRVCHPFTKNTEFEVIVPPNSEAVVIFKSVFLDGYSFSVKSNFSTLNLLGELFAEVSRHPSADLVYIDDPNDVVVEVHDTDCYNQFIKNDKDFFEVEEVKSDPAEPESPDPALIKHVLSQVQGEVIAEQAETHEHVEVVLNSLGGKN